MGIVVVMRREPLLSLLHQTVVWQPKEGDAILLENMTASHRKNLLAWFERNAPAIKFRYELAMLASAMGPLGPSGDMACDAFDQEMAWLEGVEPWEWLRKTPLVKRLRKLEKKYLKAMERAAALDGDRLGRKRTAEEIRDRR